MNSNSSATIIVTKLAAAERQLNAAIRMALSGEDELAVHTVAAASYRIFRDLKEHRGSDELRDLFARGLYFISLDLELGRLRTLPEEMKKNSAIMAQIDFLRKEIAEERLTSKSDIAINIQQTDARDYWRTFNKSSNFLKHADSDPMSYLDVTDIDNRSIILAASASFHDLLDRFSPEMYAFAVYCFGTNSNFRSKAWPGGEELAELLKKMPDDERAKYCLDLLELFREKLEISRS